MTRFNVNEADESSKPGGDDGLYCAVEVVVEGDEDGLPPSEPPPLLEATATAPATAAAAPTPTTVAVPTDIAAVDAPAAEPPTAPDVVPLVTGAVPEVIYNACVVRSSCNGLPAPVRLRNATCRLTAGKAGTGKGRNAGYQDKTQLVCADNVLDGAEFRPGVYIAVSCA